MYSPASNRIEDRARHLAVMREYNFAALITGAESRLLATHSSFMVIEDGAAFDSRCPIVSDAKAA
jgi:predicted FMN-binding regulatory protein PaiB